MRAQGRITSWKDDQGFGFITPNGGGEQVFVHIKSFSNRPRRPEVGERVSYALKTDGAGRAQAVAVAYSGERPVRVRVPGSSPMPPVFAAAFLVLLIGAAFAGRLPLAVLAFYLAASLVAFVAYYFDKRAAEEDQWRTPENTLHLFALVGGWPGALAAQRLLRHKTAKTSFQVTYWVTVVLNCGALGWLLSPAGSKMLLSVLRAV